MSTKEPKYSSLAFSVGGLFLGAIAVFAFVNPGQSIQSENLSSSIEALAIAVKNLDQKLDRFPDSAPAPESSVMGGIVRSQLDSSTVEGLVHRLGSLEGTLKSLANSLGGSTFGAVDSNGKEAPYYVETFPANTEALLSLKSHSDHQLSIGFLGWSYRGILDEFGSPDDVTRRKGGGLDFYYADLPSGGSVFIYFEDGLVVRVESSWDE